MEAKNEVLVTSDESGQSWNCCVWDYTNGTTLKVFKPGVSAPRTLQFVGGEFFIGAENGKPIINVWPLLHKGQQQHTKFVTPGKISVLALTPDATFCVAAIEEKLFIWQVCSGELLGVLRHHYNHVTCIKMTDDGSHLITAAEDNLVCVWKLSRLLRLAENLPTTVAPIYSWSDSSLPVTDVHVGCGGRKARVVTVSLDHTCRMYSLRSGELILSIIFDVSVTSVIMDPAEFHIFVGGSEGSIFTVNLVEPPTTVKSHMSGATSLTNIFVGHNKRITTLAVSSDGQFLISGSEDNLVKIWDIASKQCLRNLTHKGVVTNVLVIPALSAFNSTSMSSTKHTLVIKPFQHNVVGSDSIDEIWKHSANISIERNSKDSLMDDDLDLTKSIFKQKDVSKIKLINEVEELQKLNNDLYQKTVAEILGS